MACVFCFRFVFHFFLQPFFSHVLLFLSTPLSKPWSPLLLLLLLSLLLKLSLLLLLKL